MIKAYKHSKMHYGRKLDIKPDIKENIHLINTLYYTCYHLYSIPDRGIEIAHQYLQGFLKSVPLGIKKAYIMF